MTRGHVRTPSALLYAEGLSDGATRLWQVLDDLCRKSSAVQATVGQVAAAVSRDPQVPVSVRSVARWRAELVKAGWLRHEAARGRGEVSWWEPLNRARPVDNSVGRLTGRLTEVSASDLGKADTDVSLDGGGTRARVEEQKRAGRVIVLPLTEQRPAAPCVLCAGSRWVDSLAFPDRVERCPLCQPGSQGPF